MICTINELKQNLNIESDYTDEDEFLLYLLEVAEEVVFNYLDKTKEDYTLIPLSIKHAILVIASQYYENRTSIAFASVSKIPFTLEILLSKERNITIA